MQWLIDGVSHPGTRWLISSASYDSLSRSEKIAILERWLPEKQKEVELDASGREIDANAPYTRRVELALRAVRDGVE